MKLSFVGSTTKLRKKLVLLLLFLIVSSTIAIPQPDSILSYKQEWERRLYQFLTIDEGLSPSEWLDMFWRNFDNLSTLLPNLIAQAPSEVRPDMQRLEEYMQRVRTKLEQYDPPRREVVFVSGIEDINPRHGCADELMTILGTDFWVVEESETDRSMVIRPSNRAVMLPAKQGHRLVTDFISCTETKIELAIPSWARKGYVGITDGQLQENWRNFLVRVNTHYQTFTTLLSQYSRIGFDLPRNVSPPILYPTSTAHNLFEGTIPDIDFRITATSRGRVNTRYVETEPGCFVNFSWNVDNADFIKVKKDFFTGMNGASYDEDTILYEGSSTGITGKSIWLPQNPSLPTLDHALYGEYTYTLEATNRCGTAVESVRLKVVVPPIKVWNINMASDWEDVSPRTINLARGVALVVDYGNNRASDLFGFNECKNEDVFDGLEQVEAKRKIDCQGDIQYVFGALNFDKTVDWRFGYYSDIGINPSIAMDDSSHIIEAHSDGFDLFGESNLWHHVGIWEMWGYGFASSGRKCNIGVSPSVAVDNNGNIVEVYKSENDYTLFFRVGRLLSDKRIINWNDSEEYDIGTKPSIAMDNFGNIVEVHNMLTLGWPQKLLYRVGKLNVDQRTISWGTSYSYDNGYNASIAMDNDGNVVMVHEDSDALYCRVGALNSDQKKVKWGKIYKYGNGNDPAVAINDYGSVVEVHVYTNWESLPPINELWYRVGDLVSDPRWYERLFGNTTSDRKKVSWGDGENFDTGVSPSVTMNTCCSVVVAHRSTAGFTYKAYTPECFGRHWAFNLHPYITGYDHYFSHEVDTIWKQYGELGLLANGMKFERIGDFITREILDTGTLGRGPPLLLLGARYKIIGTDFVVPFYTTHLRGSGKASACRNLVEVISDNWQSSDLPPVLVGDFNFSIDDPSEQRDILEGSFQQVRKYFGLDSSFDHIWIGRYDRFPSSKGEWEIVSGSYDSGYRFNTIEINGEKIDVYSDHSPPSVDLRID